MLEQITCHDTAPSYDETVTGACVFDYLCDWNYPLGHSKKYACDCMISLSMTSTKNEELREKFVGREGRGKGRSFHESKFAKGNAT